MAVDWAMDSLKSILRCVRNKILWLKFLVARKIKKVDAVQFRCTICGKMATSPVSAVRSRELPSCYHCGSNVRFRSIVAALSEKVFGEIIPASEMQESKDVVGIGLSDIHNYAIPLRRIFSYENTYYHKEPRLDITAIDETMLERADFVIASDVFEHIPPPVELAFDNLFKILKNGGVGIFSVPYRELGETEEHFPELFDYRIATKEGKPVLLNTTRTGKEQVFDDLTFHGGPGATLEMRLFSKPSLLKNLKEAGFVNIKFHSHSIPEFGILFDDEATSAVISMEKPKLP